MASLEIDLTWTTDPSGLFASEADMEGVDVQASMAEYDGLLIAAVREAFPDAIVEHADKGRIWECVDDPYTTNGFNTSRTHEAGLVIQAIADDILNSGDWLVPRDS